MATSSISSITAGATSSAQNQSSNAASINNDDFMKLLLAQLKNQDPMKPMDSNEMMGQIAQLNSLNTLMEIKSSLEDLNKSQSMNLATNMIGKTIKAVIGSNEDTTIVTGIVSSMTMENGKAYVQVDGQNIEISKIVEVLAE